MQQASPHPKRRDLVAPVPVRFAVSVVLGLLGGFAASHFGPHIFAILVGWDVAAATYLVWVSATVMQYDEDETERHASSEDPSRALADLLLIAASSASLIAVGLVLFVAGDQRGLAKDLVVAVAGLSIVLSWMMLHTVFALHYARLFFASAGGGIDFNASEPGEGRPTYSDFAYVAFTVGMTFQVSDTNMRTKEIRRVVLRHALLSYLIGAVVLSMAINLLAGMSK